MFGNSCQSELLRGVAKEEDCKSNSGYPGGQVESWCKRMVQLYARAVCMRKVGGGDVGCGLMSVAAGSVAMKCTGRA